MRGVIELHVEKNNFKSHCVSSVNVWKKIIYTRIQPCHQIYLIFIKFDIS